MTELDPLTRRQLLDVLREMLPQPIREESLPDETTRLIGGDPGEVVVEISPRTVIVSEYSADEISDTAIVLKPLQLGILFWTALPAWPTRRILGELTAAAAVGRLEKFRECARCKKRVPPEAMASETICRACTAADEVGF